MKIAFTGGGTIGHVAVNMALIPAAQNRNIDICYIGSKNGIEREMMEAQFAEVPYYGISSGKLRRYFSIENAKDILKVQKGLLDALKVLKKEKPDVVFSKGGFVTVPVVIAAKLLGIKTIIHESDATPGLANKIAMKFAARLYTTFAETLNHVDEAKADYIGSIIREDLFTGSQARGYELTGFNQSKPVLLIMGGSLGSKFINNVIRENLERLTAEYQIVHITGKGLMDKTIHQSRYQQFEFLTDELPHIYAITSTVISRAGSNAIFEFLNLHIPMLLIPLGLDQSRGDQIDNAELFKKQGYAELLMEADLTAESLMAALTVIERERNDIIQTMKQSAVSYTPDTLLNKIIEDIKER